MKTYMRSIVITVVLSQSVRLENLNWTLLVANEFAGHPIGAEEFR
jgi:hypothetical protein